MKKSLFISFVLCSMLTWGQDMPEVIHAQAMEVVEATKAGDINTILDHTHPVIIDINDGRENMFNRLSQAFQANIAMGITIDSMTVSEAGEIVTAGKELHALIPQYLKMGFEGGYIESETWLLAISNDGGKHWYFLDTKMIPGEMKYSVFPDFNDELIIPEPKDPKQVFYESNE